jgi:hypothetical protein
MYKRCKLLFLVRLISFNNLSFLYELNLISKTGNLVPGRTVTKLDGGIVWSAGVGSMLNDPVGEG